MAKTFATKMQNYIGKPFREGATGPDAYDCVGFIGRYLVDSGKKIPRVFGDLTEDNYYHLARGNKKTECEMLRKWVLTLGKEISINEKVAGDIILVSISENIIFPAIYGGNNHAVAAFKSGVHVFSLEKRIMPIMVIRS